jgi:hypothetical protein
VVDPLQKLGDYLGHHSLGGLLSSPLGSDVTKPLEDLGEQEVGGKAVHESKDEVAN